MLIREESTAVLVGATQPGILPGDGNNLKILTTCDDCAVVANLLSGKSDNSSLPSTRYKS